MNASVMTDWQNIVVLAGSFVFLVFLFWRLRPMGKGIRAVSTVAKRTMQARAKAREVKTPRERAQILCEAGAQIATERTGALPALSLYLRALRTDPTWPDPIEKMRKLLWFQRPGALERILWKRLGSSSWTGAERQVAQHSARVLADLYRSRIRNRPKAAVLGKIAASLEEAVEGADKG
jgi:hypothetical protein